MQNSAQWGPPLWESMHRVALGYPEQPSATDRHAYRTFYESLGKVLPCAVCSEHYAEHLRAVHLEDYLASRDKLFEWTVLLHNAVNGTLGKPAWAVEDARGLYARTWAPGAVTTAAFASAAALVLLALVALLVSRRK